MLLFFVVEKNFDVAALRLFSIVIIFIDSYLDLPDSEDAAVLRDVFEDLAAGIVATTAPVVLRDGI